MTLLPLEAKIRDKSAIIGIVGIGYVGLPLAVAFASAGFRVLGFDIRQKNVDSVNRGESYIADVSDESLSSVVTAKFLEATTDQSRIGEVDAICICVPTPLTSTKDPDLSYVIHESDEISKYLRPGQLVVLESTTYPGTTRQVVLPRLESAGLRCGSDFYLAYSPERVDPGSKNYNAKNTPKIVGGIDPRSTQLTQLLYSQIAGTVLPVSCPEAAEMTKVFENVFRSVNIALVNELAHLCERMSLSVWEVIDAASTKPFGYMPFYPGPGVGGHCIPLDPYYLANKARELDFHTRFIELAAEINEHMPYHVVSRILEALNARGKSLGGAKVLVLGVAYKKDVEDTRESPSLKIIQLLCEKGAEVSYNDPYVARIHMPAGDMESVELSGKCLASVDCVVIAADHSCYDMAEVAACARLVFDTRGATRGLTGDNIVRLGE
ncbi:MAG TPA: nucleotide sugar dehydrogenase [Chloroflexi bacterium]|nr:nucleotide sugar dehydrogenase [Chloroflexota bacterium]